MPGERIWLSPPHMGSQELTLVNEVFETNWISTAGPHLQAFEVELEKFLGRGRVVALSSGTSAIHLALILLGVGQGDEVICSTLTFAGSCNPVTYQGAIPVFVDSEPDTWNIDPNLMENAIRDRIKIGRRPKAIIMVHLYGMPAKMHDIRSIALRYEIPLIEDAAEALGSKFNGIPLGTFGVFGILSFNGNKIITTSGGGALISEKTEMIDRARFLATQARDPAPHYQHSVIGYNYRLSNVCAAIGIGQMSVLEERVRRRRENFSFYAEALGHVEACSFLQELPGHYSNRWLTVAQVSGQGKFTNETVRLALAAENIESRPVWKPMHLQPVFEKSPRYENGTSSMLFDCGLCLPSGSSLTTNDRERIVSIILDVWKAR